MNTTIEELFHQFRDLTGDSVAAATLVLAQVQSGQANDTPPATSADAPLNPPQVAKRLRDTFTPPQVAEKLGVDSDTVRGWIRSGLLRGSNVGNSKRRPRFRIQQVDLDAFLQSRCPRQEKIAKRRSPKKPTGEIEFF